MTLVSQLHKSDVLAMCVVMLLEALVGMSCVLGLPTESFGYSDATCASFALPHSFVFRRGSRHLHHGAMFREKLLGV